MKNNLKPIGLIGIGLMGNALAQRLSNCNYEVHVFDKDKLKLSKISYKNVFIKNNISEISKTCDFILICVDKTENVEKVVFNKNGIIKNATEKTIIIDLSTTLANETIKFSNQFNNLTKGYWVDAPVSGGPEKALDGSLSIMLGGNIKNINLISSLINDISKKSTHFGPVGSGQIVKMINQILVLNNYTILAEALAFSEAWGIDSKKIPNALKDGHAGSNLLSNLFPRMIENDFNPQGYTSQILKDLNMVSQLAEEKNVPIPISSLSKQLFTILANKSEQNLDGLSVVKLFDKNKKL